MHITKGKADWIDILNPTQEDLGWLKEKFNIHDIILEELKEPSGRSKVEAYDHYLFLVYYFPIYDEKEQSSRRAEIDFIITRHQVITVHYETIEPFSTIDINTAENSLELMHIIMSALLIFEERQLKHVQDKIEEVGGKLFKGREKEILRKISRLKRDISEYRITIRHQEPLLDSLLLRGLEFWGPDSKVYLNDLIGTNQKIENQIQNYRETANDFEDTNNQLMSLKINNVMKTFTILSFLTFPFVLVATVFGLQVADNPFLSMPHAFVILVSVLVISISGLSIYFINKKWL